MTTAKITMLSNSGKYIITFTESHDRIKTTVSLVENKKMNFIFLISRAGIRWSWAPDMQIGSQLAVICSTIMIESNEKILSNDDNTMKKFIEEVIVKF